MAPLKLFTSVLLGSLLALSSSSAPLTSLSKPASIPSPISSSGSPASYLSNSDVFSRILLMSLEYAAAPYINLKPALPEIPNVFVPMTSRPEQDPDKPNQVDAGGPPPPMPTVAMPLDIEPEIKDEQYGASPSNPFERPLLAVEQIIQRCMENRTPDLPSTFGPEVGVVRLFKEASFRVEVAILKGCGCAALIEPKEIHSFVGSRNHSFAFYEKERCEGEPYHQRFQSSHKISLKKLARSVKIIQGVLPPIS